MVKSLFSVFLLILLNTLSTADEEVATPARLLIEKQILNKYLVENRDIIIHYNIFNVGQRFD
jgi:translocon-associated protein subunit beta